MSSDEPSAGRPVLLACITCALISIGALWYTASQLGAMRSTQAEQTDLLNKVLKRIPGMTTFSQDVTNQANHVIHVSVTCRENEELRDCFNRFTAAVAVAAASNT